jgi:hypothetical protein
VLGGGRKTIDYRRKMGMFGGSELGKISFV